MIFAILLDLVISILLFVVVWLIVNYWGQFTVSGKDTPLQFDHFFWWCWENNGFKCQIDVESRNWIASLSGFSAKVFPYCLFMCIIHEYKCIRKWVEDPLRRYKLKSHVLSLDMPRKPSGDICEEDQFWLTEETLLRKCQYELELCSGKPGVPISFLDDSDIHGSYKLILIYRHNGDKGRQLLASARIHSNKIDIERELKDTKVRSAHVFGIKGAKQCKFLVLEHLYDRHDSIENEEVTIIERLVINGRARPSIIHCAARLALYKKIASECKQTKKFIAIARESPTEQLLRSYLPLGFTITGEVNKEITTDRHLYKHWVLCADRDKLTDHTKQTLELTRILNSAL